MSQTLQITTDLDLASTLAGAILIQGLEESVTEIIRKASAKGPHERWQRVLVQRLIDRYATTIEALATNLKTWFDLFAPAPDPWTIEKADVPTVLTPEQIEELRLLIASHFRSPTVTTTAEAWGVPEDMWRRWQTRGIVPRGMPIPEILDAYQAGRLFQILASRSSYEQMRQMALQLPRTRMHELAIQHAAQQAASTLTDFGQRLAGRAGQRALAANQALARRIITSHLRGTLAAAGATPPLTRDDVVDTWRGLARRLYEEFASIDARRDWQRVAVSETRLAYNVGRIRAMEERGTRQVYYHVLPDACQHCRRLLLKSDGTPRIFRLDTLLDTLATTGGLNRGRLASRIGDPDRGWLPTALIHPWCFPGDVMVEGACVAGLEAQYAGPLVIVQTKSGHRLPITPNHPIATSRGMIPAGALRKGDNVVCKITSRDMVGTRLGRNDQNGPTFLHQIIQTLRLRGSTALQPRRLDLHGDAMFLESNIDIVGADWQLGRGDGARTPKCANGCVLQLASVDESLEVGLRTRDQLSQGCLSSSGRLPGSFQLPLDERGALFDVGPLEALCFGSASQWNVSLSQAAREIAPVFSCFLRDLQQRSAGQIALDRVVDVSHQIYHGPVYDVQSTTGWIIANGIVTSNCRCTPMPVIPTFSPTRTP